MTWQLLEPEFKVPKGARLWFDTSAVEILQEKRNEVYERAIRALTSGGTTINQFLSSIDKPTVEGLDIHFIPSLATPMTTERLIEKAKEEPQPPPEPVSPVDAAALAKLAEMDYLFVNLEREMKVFMERRFVNENRNA